MPPRAARSRNKSSPSASESERPLSRLDLPLLAFRTSREWISAVLNPQGGSNLLQQPLETNKVVSVLNSGYASTFCTLQALTEMPSKVFGPVLGWDTETHGSTGQQVQARQRGSPGKTGNPAARDACGRLWEYFLEFI